MEKDTIHLLMNCLNGRSHYSLESVKAINKLLYVYEGGYIGYWEKMKNVYTNQKITYEDELISKNKKELQNITFIFGFNIISFSLLTIFFCFIFFIADPTSWVEYLIVITLIVSGVAMCILFNTARLRLYRTVITKNGIEQPNKFLKKKYIAFSEIKIITIHLRFIEICSSTVSIPISRQLYDEQELFGLLKEKCPKAWMKEC